MNKLCMRMKKSKSRDDLLKCDLNLLQLSVNVSPIYLYCMVSVYPFYPSVISKSLYWGFIQYQFLPKKDSKRLNCGTVRHNQTAEFYTLLI